MNIHNILRATIACCAATTSGGANASIIDFDSLSLVGPDTYFSAGPTRDLNIATGDSATPTVSITGGTVLTNETFLPANHTSLYGTAFFGTTYPAPAHAYSPAIVLKFANPISNFYLDVYNGQVFNVTYTVSDNLGHSSSFLLAPNLSSGTSQIGFAAAGSVITITSDAGNLWDFSIDNIGFNEALPATIPSTVQPTPSTSSPSDPPITLIALDQPPPIPSLTPEQRELEGLDNQKRKGRHGDPSRLRAQGFDDSVATVPLPPSLLLFGSALAGIAGISRRQIGRYLS